MTLDHALQPDAPAQVGNLDPSGDFLAALGGQRFGCVLADPPWQFINRTGKMAPEHKRLSRYGTMDLLSISKLPVQAVSAPTSQLYLSLGAERLVTARLTRHAGMGLQLQVEPCLA